MTRMWRSPTLVYTWNIACQLSYLYAWLLQHRVGAGVCWESIDTTTNWCKQAYHTNMTYRECCDVSGLMSAGWTEHETSSSIFYWVFMAEGARECRRCHRNCDSMDCGKSKYCTMINGYPKCVCKPRCAKELKSRGQLCGSDGRRYKNYCALQRTNCEEEREITVDYFGKCRRSCKRVNCDNGRRCVEDQDGYPHCIRCHEDCSMVPDNPRNYFCAVDGHTYRSTCEIRAQICRHGQSIHFAYHGRCKENITCNDVQCGPTQRCLIHVHTRQPVCTNCDQHCVPSRNVRVCGTDGRTYNTYCDLKRARCERGLFFTTKKSGPCKQHNKTVILDSTSKSKSKDKGRSARVKRKHTMKKKRKHKNRKRRRKGKLSRKHRRHKRIKNKITKPPKGTKPFKDRGKNKMRDRSNRGRLKARRKSARAGE